MFKILLRYWLKRSVKRDGTLAPILISRNGTVLDGNHRVMIARELNKSVPVIRLDVDIEWVNPNELKTYFDSPQY